MQAGAAVTRGPAASDPGGQAAAAAPARTVEEDATKHSAQDYKQVNQYIKKAETISQNIKKLKQQSN